MKFLIAFILSVVSSFAVTENEMVAAVIIAEAGGEGEVGMQAVANVIENRAAKQSLTNVIARKKQFSCVNQITVENAETWQQFVDRMRKHARWSVALDYAKRIRELEDITDGATHYHATSVRPYWTKKIPFKKTIGRHMFYD